MFTRSFLREVTVTKFMSQLFRSVFGMRKLIWMPFEFKHRFTVIFQVVFHPDMHVRSHRIPLIWIKMLDKQSEEYGCELMSAQCCSASCISCLQLTFENRSWFADLLDNLSRGQPLYWGLRLRSVTTHLIFFLFPSRLNITMVKKTAV